MMTAMMSSPIFIHHKTGELANSSHCGSAGPGNEVHNIGKDDDGDDGGDDDDDDGGGEEEDDDDDVGGIISCPQQLNR